MQTTETNLFAVADNIEQGMSLFRAGFKAEVYWGDDVTALHMNTRSVYRFKENTDVAITHSAPYGVNGDWDKSVDQFYVCVTEYETPRHSVTSRVGTFDTWLSAYYCALEQIRKRSK
jgi:hypothetical protein